MDLLKTKFKEALGDRAKNVDINTIDGFQVGMSSCIGDLNVM